MKIAQIFRGSWIYGRCYQQISITTKTCSLISLGYPWSVTWLCQVCTTRHRF